MEQKRNEGAQGQGKHKKRQERQDTRPAITLSFIVTLRVFPRV